MSVLVSKQEPVATRADRQVLKAGMQALMVGMRVELELVVKALHLLTCPSLAHHPWGPMACSLVAGMGPLG